MADAIVTDRARVQALASLARALAAARQPEAAPTFAEARTVASAITRDWTRADALVALAEALVAAGNQPTVVDLAQRAWIQAMTRNEALHLMLVVVPFVRHSPDLALQLVDGITWVDRFLRGEGSL